MPEKTEIVWMVDENFNRYPAELVQLGSYCSTVRYTREGTDFEVLVMNDEFEYGEEDDTNGDDEN